MDDKIKIKLTIAEIPFPTTISRSEEEVIREAAKQVNVKVDAYRKRYADSVSTEKILAMAAFQFSLDLIKQKQCNDTGPYDEKVRELTGMLDEYLKG